MLKLEIFRQIIENLTLAETEKIEEPSKGSSLNGNIEEVSEKLLL